MPQNRTTNPARAYGPGETTVWGGFLPYGSSAGGSSPIIPLIIIDPIFGAQPRWTKFTVAHDGYETGRYVIMLDSDTFDFIPAIQADVNRKWSAATAYVPGATSGHGLTFFANASGSAGNLISITVATGSTLAVANSGNAITITLGTGGSTLAAVAALINSATGQSDIDGLVTASLGDSTKYTADSGPIYLTGGQNSNELCYADAFIHSDTAGSGLEFTAINPGAAGNAIRIVYVYSGTSAPAVAVVGNTITVTIATSTGSTTNASIAAAFAASAAASALVSVAVVGLGSDTNTTTTFNLHDGTALTGGGFTVAKLDGRINPKALANSGILNYDALSAAQKQELPITAPYSHFAVKVYCGDTLMDLNAQAQLFIPSETQGSGVMVNSLATQASAASAAFAFTGSSATNTVTALQPGDQGNKISVTYENPQATLFIPSTTAGSGLFFQATASYAGQAGTQISVAIAAPNPNSGVTTVNVNNLAITVYPKAAETNNGISAAVAAYPAAANLVGTPTTYSGGVPASSTDLVTGNGGAQTLGGGYVAASGSASAAITGSPTTGWTITVQFGANTTNTTAVAAINAIAGAASPFPVVLAAVTGGTGADHVAPAGAQFLTGGSDPSDLQVVYTGPYQTNTTVQATLDGSGDLAALNVASTANFPSAGTIDVLSSTGVIQTLAYTGVTATSFTTLTGGTAGATILAGALVYADAPFALQVGELCTVYLGFTAANNTNSAIAAVINAAQAEGPSPLLSAVVLGTASDLNEIDPQGLLSWGATGQQAAQNLECLNAIRFVLTCIDSVANGGM